MLDRLAECARTGYSLKQQFVLSKAVYCKVEHAIGLQELLICCLRTVSRSQSETMQFCNVSLNALVSLLGVMSIRGRIVSNTDESAAV